MLFFIALVDSDLATCEGKFIHKFRTILVKECWNWLWLVLMLVISRPLERVLSKELKSEKFEVVAGSYMSLHIL